MLRKKPEQTIILNVGDDSDGEGSVAEVPEEDIKDVESFIGLMCIIVPT